MTDYSKNNPVKKYSQKKENFYNERYKSFYNEEEKSITSNFETDTEIQTYSDFIKTFKPDIKAKHPSTFSFYGSAEQYYIDAFYNILNYYPFDGTREEVIEWHKTSPDLDSGLVKQFWPGTTGHLVFNYSEYVDFYAGPQSITEYEFNGTLKFNETGLKLSGEQGNTLEFWLKKSAYSDSNQKETIVHIGTYPGKEESSASGELKVYLSNAVTDSGNTFHITYKSGSVGVTDLQLIDDNSLTKSSVADSNWHHYAFRIYASDSSLEIKTYKDGNYINKTTASIASSMGSVDSYMAGAIAADISTYTNKLSGSVDEFRFWKGLRTSEQIGRFYDKKVYASSTKEKEYVSRLGVKFSFNKNPSQNDELDSLVVDTSGNDILGRIKNYTSSVRSTDSAIDLSTVSKNLELKDPVLEPSHAQVLKLREEVVKIGESYDKENSKSLINYLPEWIRSYSKEDQSDREIRLLLQILASEFDSIKTKISSIRDLTSPSYSEPLLATDKDSENIDNIKTYDHHGNPNGIYFQCSSSDIDNDLVSGNEIDFFQRMIDDCGIQPTEDILLLSATPEEEYYNIIGHERINKSIYETRNLLYKSLANSLSFIMKKKGTQSSYRTLLNSIAGGNDIISTNIVGMDNDIFLTKEKQSPKTIETKSINFLQNNNECLFLNSESSDQRTFIEATSQETEYTVEGTFLFPETIELSYDVLESSIFGLHEVSATNNNLTISSPDRASFQVFIKKSSSSAQSCKFILKSDAGIIADLETENFYDVYKNTKWNLAIRITKEQDNKFIPASSNTKYKVEFSGKSYLSTEIANQFSVSSTITKAQYDNFNQSNKTFYIGAHRTNITGATISKTDIKVVNFNFWTRALTDEELDLRAKNFTIMGFNNNYKLTNLPDGQEMYNDLAASYILDAVSSLEDDNTIKIVDTTLGTADDRVSFGNLLGHKYNLKSTPFTNTKLLIQPEFLTALISEPIQNLLSLDSVQVKDSDFNKFDIESRPLIKILSFEKSMYRAVTDEMVKFAGGTKSINNIIGEPVNKYRMKYKLLEHLKSTFFSFVKNENQFERYVDYYRWIDKTIGEFLNQLVPASMLSNTGIENVIESHFLERNKYRHKFTNIDTKDLFLETNLLSINELLYDWEHGHYNSNENEHCLWQKDRKVKQPIREPLRKVLTTVVTGSDQGKYFNNYILRNLVRPYVHYGEKTLDFKVGNNKKANKIDLFYTIIDSGKDITLKQEDIYEFKQCKDIIDPDKKTRYVAKIDVSGTSGYLDGDADLLLPFSLYSSSAGTVFEDFKSNLQITNNLHDYGTLQSFWIRENFNQPSHRKVRLGQYTAEADGYQKDRPESYIISNVRPAATATITFTGNPTINQTITITSTDGTELTYSAKSSANSSARTFDCNNGILTSAETLKEAIEDSTASTGGHAGKILVSNDGSGTLTLTQSSPGPEGNISIVHNLSNTTVLGFTGGSSTISVSKPTSASSLFHRNLEGSRFYNISNLKTVISGSQLITQGNYVKDYEIVKTSGRNINNTYLVETEGKTLTGSLALSAYVQGLVDYDDSRDEEWESQFTEKLKEINEPIRPRREHVFVTRFSPLGGPETHGAYGRDRVSGEFSIFNSVNYRNRIVRDVYDFISQEHSTQLGYRPVTSSATGEYFIGSIHKTNRNELRFTGSLGNEINYDNFYIQHHIPQQDFQYSWITASANESVYSFLNKNANFGHQHEFNISGSLESCETISFLESSQQTGSLSFVNLNTNTTRSIDIDSNLETHQTKELNSIILNRQGPYGWNSWKQIRGYQHPIIKKHKLENIFSVSIRGSEAFPRPFSELQGERIHTSNRVNKNYHEIMVTNRFKPSNFSVHIMSAENAQSFGALNEINKLKSTTSQTDYHRSWNYDSFFDSLGVSPEGTSYRSRDLPTFSKRLTISNDVSKLANETLQEDISLTEKNFQTHKNLIKLNDYIAHTEQENILELPSILREVNYIEKIYPREINTFASSSRGRTRFVFFGWDSKRDNRDLILSGNLQYTNFRTATYGSKSYKFFPTITAISAEKVFSKSYYDKVEHIDLNTTASSASTSNCKYITSSTWVLDARKDYNSVPLSLTSSFMSGGSDFMGTREQGTRGEGILQNDYSIYALGINNLYGAPPISPVYNRRIPQNYGNNEFLSGEARWDKGINHSIGPFYDEYLKFSEETNILNQQRTIIPEFTMSRYAEDAIKDVQNGTLDPLGKIETMNDFLEVTGAIYNTSSQSFEVGKRFFKTYSTSDFLKYFTDFQSNIENNDFSFKPFRFNLKCKATKRFLPYRGFYPAERAVQLSEIFSRCYLSDGTYQKQTNSLINTIFGSEDIANSVFDAKIQNSKAQAAKVLFGPGVFFNSIKSGLAVDYPMFSGSSGDFETVIRDKHINFSGSAITSWPATTNGGISFVTGSEINSTKDAGIPRLKGTVFKRITFEDMLRPAQLWDLEIFDNEPHPSASLYYGSYEHFRVLDRPFKFGSLDRENSREFNGIDFKNDRTQFANSMAPYEGAMQNFVAQTVEFFLEDQKLQTIVSKPVKPYLKSGVTYIMRVFLHNSGISMYDRHSAFGPPVDEGNTSFTSYQASSTDSVTAVPASGSISLESLKSDSSPSSTLEGDTFTLKDADSLSKTYVFLKSSGGTQAFATINFSALAASDTIKDNMLNSSVLVLAQAGGSTKSYLFTNNLAAGSTGGTDGSKIVVQTNGINSLKKQMAELDTAINSGNGHGSGAFTLSHNSSTRVLTIEQTVVGAFTTSVTGDGNFEKTTITGFTGGTAATTYTTGDVTTSGVVISTQGLNLSQIGAQMDLAVEGSTGHNGTIISSYDATTYKLSVAQATSGVSGNNTISKTGTNLSTVGFDGGVDSSSGDSVAGFYSSTSTSVPNSHGYLPYVPPYLDPETTPYAEISFTPDRGNTDYTIPEIIEKASISYYNDIPSADNDNYNNSMQISASLNLLSHVTLLRDNYQLDINANTQEMNIKRDPDDDLPRWVIQTKWETPILDFKNATASTINLASLTGSTAPEVSSATGSPWKRRYQSNYYEKKENSSIPYLTSSTGMWHQSGTIPPNSDGYILSVTGPNSSENYGDLAEKLGFVEQANPTGQSATTSYSLESIRKLGVLASDKQISEAIVVIPFYQKTQDSEPSFFHINDDIKRQAERINELFTEQELRMRLENPDLGQSETDNWLGQPHAADGASAFAYQLRMMNKYILPPHFDFIRNHPYITPHLQYFFQFNAKITKEQLKDLWENVYPSQSYGIFRAQNSNIEPTQEQIDNRISTTDVEYISHYLDVSPMINFQELKTNLQDPESFYKEKVRWLVFKAKYRANSSYECLKLKSIDYPASILQKDGVPNPYNNLDVLSFQDNGFRFNWPYDYFSIIEGAEIHAKMDFYSDYTGPEVQTTVSAYTSAEGSEPLQYEIVEEGNFRKQISQFQAINTIQKLGQFNTGYSLVGPTTTQATAQQYQIVGSSSGSSTSNLVIRQLVKSDSEAAPTPANVFTITVDSGFSLKTNSESIYVNGILQASGATNDYTMSGNVITFNENIENGDSIYITYIKE